MLVRLRVVVRVLVAIPRSVGKCEPVVCKRQQGDDRPTDERFKEEPSKGQWLLEKDITA